MSHERPTHLDIFSGIGGFAIAAQWAGFKTVAFCEKDVRCRRFLERTWNLTCHDDIRTMPAIRYRGVSLLTGGPPCQPASRAGNQGGEGDDRWLWPEALRVLEEAKPDAVVFENPLGILDVGIDGILSEMGRIGYEVQPFDIPACGVDSPQLRHRIWIVGFLAHGNEPRRESVGISGSGELERACRNQPNGCAQVDLAYGDLAHDEEQGSQGHRRRGMGDGTLRRENQDRSTTACGQSDLAYAGCVRTDAWWNSEPEKMRRTNVTPCA